MNPLLPILATALCAVVTPLRAAQPAEPLAAFVSEILISHPELSARRADVDAALSRRSAAARPLYNPRLELEAERAGETTGTAGLRQTLDLSGKRRSRTAVAASNLDEAKARLDAARLRIASTVLEALARHRTAVAAIALAERRVALMKRFVELSEQRHAAGDLQLADLELARLAYAESRLQRTAAARDVIDAGQDLRALYGTVAEWPRLPEATPAPSAVSPARRERLLDRLPSLRAARSRVAAARGAVRLQEDRRRPDPTVGLRLGNEGAESLTGLVISVPLFVRNTYRAEVETAAAESAAAEERLAALRRASAARLGAALDAYRLEHRTHEQWQALGAKSLGRQERLSERLWSAGEIGAADYLLRLDRALETRAEAVRQRGRLRGAWIRWLDASGQTLEWLGLSDTAFAGE